MDTSSTVIGFLIMLPCLSLIFFGVRAYRNNVLDGAISLWRAFVCGLYIAVIASALYAIGWVIYFNTMGDGGMMDTYFQSQVAQVTSQAENPEQAARKIEDLHTMRELYFSNNFFVFGLTLIEVFPFSLVITILTALILKRKPRYVMP